MDEFLFSTFTCRLKVFLPYGTHQQLAVGDMTMSG